MLLLGFGGCAVTYNVVVTPLPAPEVAPLPDDVRTVLWVADGGEPTGERRMGVLALVLCVTRSLNGGRPPATPQVWVPSDAAREWVLARGTHGHLDWHLSNLRTSLRIARWWSVDQALDYAGARLRERAEDHYGVPLDGLALEQVVVVVAHHQGYRNAPERARFLLSRMASPRQPRR